MALNICIQLMMSTILQVQKTNQQHNFINSRKNGAFFLNNINYELDYLFSSKELLQSASQTLSTA